MTLSSNVKPVTARKTKKATAEPKNVPTLQQLYENEKAAKLEIAREFRQQNHLEKVDIRSDNGEIVGLSVTNDRVLRMAEANARKHLDSIRLSITQCVRVRQTQEGEDYGKEYLIIDGFMHYKDLVGQAAKAYYQIGRIQKPIFIKRPSSFDPKSGELLSYETSLDGFQDVYTIPCSPELLQSLRKHFSQPSLIINGGGRKYTVTEDEFVNGEFEAVRKHVTPKTRREDGSAE